VSVISVKTLCEHKTPYLLTYVPAVYFELLKQAGFTPGMKKRRIIMDDDTGDDGKDELACVK